MKKRQWTVRRHIAQTAEAQRRWDQAYQYLVGWSAVALKQAPHGPIREQSSDESSHVCTCLYAAAGASADH